MDGWRHWLTSAAFAGAVLWLAVLVRLELQWRPRPRRRRLLRALPALGLVGLIALFIYVR